MSRLSQVLLLDPAHELHFQGPYKTDVTSHLGLSNPTDHPVAFKVKTTAPKRYCVRPNSGIIEPKQSMKLVVILRSFDAKDQPTEQVKDKFMVQSIMCEDGTQWSENIFKDASPDQLMDSKIRCVFDVPAVQASSDNKQLDDVKPIEEIKAKEVPGDYGSAVETISQLREENSRLLREKLDLQEEAAKLRKRAAVAAAAASSAEEVASTMQKMENKPPGVNLTMEVLAVAFVVTFFVALFMGKMVL